MKKMRWIGIFLILSVLLLPGKQAMAAGEIKIDGYFDDWEHIPKSLTYHGNFDSEEKHEAAMILDEEYVYIYVRMSDLYQSQIPVGVYCITANGQTVQLSIWGKDASGAIKYDFNVHNMGQGTHVDEIGLFWAEKSKISLGDVAVTVADGNPNDTLEMRVKLSVLEELMGFEEGTIKSGAEISFQNPNIGKHSVKLVGSSSGAVLGAVLCVASVGVAWFFNRKRKQRV